MEQFAQLVEGAVPQEALTWTEDQAVEAFLNGEAAILFAGSGVGEELAASLPEAAGGPSAVQGAQGLHHRPDQYVAGCLRPQPGAGNRRPLPAVPLQRR